MGDFEGSSEAVTTTLLKVIVVRGGEICHTGISKFQLTPTLYQSVFFSFRLCGSLTKGKPKPITRCLVSNFQSWAYLVSRGLCKL